ncbi:MAG: hypothetical protein HOV83_28105 [Catenulispora sp.]|nr:hypothetical protein [Catenulispora sp.]
MTQNSNIPPDPSAGQPPEAVSGEPVPTPPKTPKTPKTPRTPQTPPAAPAEPALGASGGTDATAAGSEVPEADPIWAAPDDEADDTAAGYDEPFDPDTPNTGVAATFLPGIDAASILALVLSLLAAGAFLLVYPLVQAHSAARTWSDFKNNVPRARQDPFGTERDWIQYQSWTHIILGLVAVLLALLVLGLWTARRNRLYSRAFAQAALVLGLAVVLYGILLKTGAVGSEIPSMKEIGGALNSQQ